MISHSETLLGTNRKNVRGCVQRVTLWIGILNLYSKNLGALNIDTGYVTGYVRPTGLLVQRPRIPQSAHIDTRSENVCGVFEIGQGIHSHG